MGFWAYYRSALVWTWRATFGWIREHGILELLVVVVPFPIALLLQSGEETLDRLAVSLLASLAALGLLTLGVFAVNLVLAPARMSREAEIETRRERLEQQHRIDGLQEQQAEAQDRITELEDDHPTIEVRAFRDVRSRMIVEVTNLGERGEFEAQIEMIEGRDFVHGPIRPTLPRYTGYWERSAGPVARLPQGHSDRLLLGELELGGATMTASFRMFFYSALTHEPLTYGTTSWVLLKDSGTLAARFVFRMTISSAPRILRGPFERLYLVDGRGDQLLQEVTEGMIHSTPDMEGPAPE